MERSPAAYWMPAFADMTAACDRTPIEFRLCRPVYAASVSFGGLARTERLRPLALAK